MASKGIVALVVTASLGALVTASVVAAQDGKQDDSTKGERTMDVAAYQTEVARLKASLGPQTDVLSSHQKPEDFRSLPLIELGASFGQASSLDSAFEAAQIIVEAELLGVRFEGSGLGDLPAAVKTYEVTKSLKGSANVGDHLVERVLGGPYRQADGKVVYVALPRSTVDVPGERLFLFLDDLGAAGVGNNDISVRFKLDASGRIAPSENAAALDLAGLTPTQVIAASR